MCFLTVILHSNYHNLIKKCITVTFAASEEKNAEIRPFTHKMKKILTKEEKKVKIYVSFVLYL